MSDRIIGTVIRLKDAGFGFLACESGNIFFHCSDLPPGIRHEDSMGRRFDFALETEDGKLRARDLYEFTGGETMTGVVGSIRADRDFAFIRHRDGEIFFHRTDVRGDFQTLAGKRVSFEIQPTARGPRAVCVEAIECAEQ